MEYTQTHPIKTETLKGIDQYSHGGDMTTSTTLHSICNILHLDYATFQHEVKQEGPYLDKKRRSIIVPPYLMKWFQQIRM